MRIEILITFQHNSNSYIQSEIRVVPDDIGLYFCSTGWAKEVDSEAPATTPNTSEIILNIDPLDQSTISIF